MEDSRVFSPDEIIWSEIFGPGICSENGCEREATHIRREAIPGVPIAVCAREYMVCNHHSKA